VDDNEAKFWEWIFIIGIIGTMMIAVGLRINPVMASHLIPPPLLMG
jgi:hypothetical protein